MMAGLEDAYEAVENVQLGLLSCWLTSKGYREETLSWLLLGLSLELLDLMDALETPR